MSYDPDIGGVGGNDSTNMNYTRSSKSRVHWTVPRCLRDSKCKNYPKKCDECMRYSNWEEK